jgi:mRNA-degrading endonuclease RelE of RelBE toxin-antitoxin system
MFEVIFTDSALDDLRFLKKNERNVVLDAIEQQLATQPLTETRNRKRMRDNELAGWELRVGDFRVYYNVEEASQHVNIRAVGWKVHNVLFIRGKEYPL